MTLLSKIRRLVADIVFPEYREEAKRREATIRDLVEREKIMRTRNE